MKGIASSLLLYGLLIASYNVEMAYGGDWLNDLLSRINENVNEEVARINENVSKQVAQINENVSKQVAHANDYIQEALKNVDKGSVMQINGGRTVVVNNNGGNSLTVYSGVDANGQPYYIESQNLKLDNKLYHTDRVYNYTSKKIDERRYTLDLNDPNAKPVYTDDRSY